MPKKIRIGELLVQKKLLTQKQLDTVIVKQQKEGGKLGKLIVEAGFITEEQLLKLLSEQLQLPFIDLKHYEINSELIHLLPETHARRYRALILQETKAGLLVGMADPLDIYAFDQLSKVLRRPFDLALVKEKELLSCIDLVYRKTEAISRFAEELSGELQDDKININAIESLSVEDAPVVKLLESVFTDAIQMRASDIHIEPDEKVLRIRLRIDGVLQEQVMKEKDISAALTQRLKLMAGLNIAERRLPQDGRFNINVKGRTIDIRLSTMPTQYGESVVMRLLDPLSALTDLNNLGMPDDMLACIHELICKPHGIILVTGPTGSGKTTTLYSILSELNKVDKKIITVEDPIEYRLPRINQVQVNPKINLGFSEVLRASLRQDPDILLVGEIRDHETAAIALRAAMTGHLVFATLHTNDAVSSAIRLIDIGAAGYLVATSLQAVLAQRLVKRVCISCAEEYVLTANEKNWLKKFNNTKNNRSMTFKKGRGCNHCQQTGYQGRIGVFELLVLNEMMGDALRRNDAQEFMQVVRSQNNWQSLGSSALDLAAQGMTTLSEAYRVSNDVELIHSSLMFEKTNTFSSTQDEKKEMHPDVF